MSSWRHAIRQIPYKDTILYYFWDYVSFLALSRHDPYTNELAEAQADQMQDAITLMDGMNRQIAHLETENQQLRQALAAQQRHSARIEVRTNLTRLTQEQALQSLQVLFAMDPGNANARRLTRNNEGTFTHVVTWSGLRRSLATLLQRPEGYTLQELSAFLAKQGLSVPNPAHLENAVFMVLDIAEPRQG